MLHYARDKDNGLCMFIPTRFTKIFIQPGNITYSISQKYKFGFRELTKEFWGSITTLNVIKKFYESKVQNLADIIPEVTLLLERVQLEDMTRNLTTIDIADIAVGLPLLF